MPNHFRPDTSNTNTPFWARTRRHAGFSAMDFAMIKTDQYSAFEAITARLASTAVWRRSMATKFPDDMRNGPAAVWLEKLAAADCDDVLPDSWAELDLAHPKFHQALNDTARAVGFRIRPINLDHFVMSVADRVGGVL
jgi:hypothetical protein